MSDTNRQRCVVYIGDFDLRNQNVQAHLVKNNAKILNKLGYVVAFIGVNRNASYEEIKSFPSIDLGAGNLYLELENTLSFKGLLKYGQTTRRIVNFIDFTSHVLNVKFIISYQSPTFSPILKKVAKWCKKNDVKYIVNCADITIFESQPWLRRIAMTLNWNYLHKINKKYADGLISVSRYIEKFYYKDGLPSIIIPPLFDDYDDTCFELSKFTTLVYAGFPFVLKKKVKTVGMKDRLDIIVDLCLKLTDKGMKYNLVIIGITKDLYLTCIPRHKEALEKNSDIVFMGRLSHNETLKVVRNADYMINYRDRNIMNEAGLSTKVVESVSLGTPVVMNSVGDNFLYLREGITGFELLGNVDKDVELLKSLCKKNYNERKNLKNSCTGDRTFSTEKYESKFHDFLIKVLSATE